MNAGYISVNSWVSPTTEPARFSAVDFDAPITPRRARAWIASASDAARKSFATAGKPSCAAFSENARYFRLAWDSPANAAPTLSMVDMDTNGAG